MRPRYQNSVARLRNIALENHRGDVIRSAGGVSRFDQSSADVIERGRLIAEDLDQARAEAGMTRAEEMLAPVPHEIDFERARVALLRTLQQLQSESRRGVGH